MVIEICSGCQKEIDTDVCWCGTLHEDHKFVYDHPFIPIGCDCCREQVETDSNLSNSHTCPQPQKEEP
jgi:hypothetical protein